MAAAFCEENVFSRPCLGNLLDGHTRGWSYVFLISGRSFALNHTSAANGLWAGNGVFSSTLAFDAHDVWGESFQHAWTLSSASVSKQEAGMCANRSPQKVVFVPRLHGVHYSKDNRRQNFKKYFWKSLLGCLVLMQVFLSVHLFLTCIHNQFLVSKEASFSWNVFNLETVSA